MEYSEIVVVLLVYSGSIAFFLVPFQGEWNLINQQQSHVKFREVFKVSLTSMVFHKKAILALVLLSFTLFITWSIYQGAEYHFNAHSGYPPVSTDLKAIYSMGGVLVYTVVLSLLIAFVRTLKIVRNAR